MTSAETIAALNRDTANTANSLKPIFDKKKVEAGFEIVTAFQQQADQFLTNRAQEIDALKVRGQDPTLTPAEREQALAAAFKLEGQWGPSGTYRRVLSALSAGAAGDVTGSSGAFMQSAAVNYLQGLSASEVKKIADSLGPGPKAEAVRTSLHAIVGCAGAAASGQACSAGALGAGASSVFATLLKHVAGESLSAQEREARGNLLASLVTGVAQALPVETATSTLAAVTEATNNALRLGELKSFAVQAASCEVLSNCEQIREQFQQLSLKNRDEMISVCAQDSAQCRQNYGEFVEGVTAYRQELDAINTMTLPAGFKTDLAVYLMQHQEAISVALNTELAVQLQDRYGLSMERATQVAGVAMGAVGVVKGARNTAKTIGDKNSVATDGRITRAVLTPYGEAIQSRDAVAIAACTKVEQGATLYRIGTIGKSEAAEAQFWSLEHPSSPGYAARYGVPAENIANANFVETATIKPGTIFVTRSAPAVGNSPGGGIEVVVPPGGVQIKYFGTTK